MEHGTASGYNRCLRRPDGACDACREAAAEYQAARRTARAGQEPPEHGVDSSYTNWSCRCPECTDAHRVASRNGGGSTIAPLNPRTRTNRKRGNSDA